VIRIPQPKLATYLTFVAVALLAAVALGRAELAATAMPFALFVLAGVLGTLEPDVRARLTIDSDRIQEGEQVAIAVELYAKRAVRQLRLEPVVAGGHVLLVSLAADETRRVIIAAPAARWGGFSLGPVRVDVLDDFGLHADHGRLGTPIALRVYPRRELLHDGLRPHTTRPQPGMLPSNARGEGLELAELRPFAPGDRVRRINWRATARRGRSYVTERQLDRGADVVLFLDTFVRAGDGRDGTLEATVRAADSLASRHLARGDRVGLVSFGGVLDWLLPGGGARQRWRIVEALIRSEVVFSYTTRDARILPARLLPARALVVGITPLLDERGLVALLDLRARGFDVAVLVVSPARFVPTATDASDRLAHRLWRLQRDAQRLRLEHAGIAVVTWEPPAPLEAAVTEVNAFRRFAHQAG
jgi:uncharacterized protein (DUF58 family)